MTIDDTEEETNYCKAKKMKSLKDSLDKVLVALRAECDYLEGRTGQWSTDRAAPLVSTH